MPRSAVPLPQEGGYSQSVGKRDVADVAAQTSATCLMGLLDEETAIPPTTDSLTPEIKEQHHTSYVRGGIEGTEVNILVDSGATESFISAEFRKSVPAFHRRPLQADFVAARAVNGQMLDMLGTITATLHLGNHSWQHVSCALGVYTDSTIRPGLPGSEPCPERRDTSRGVFLGGQVRDCATHTCSG